MADPHWKPSKQTIQEEQAARPVRELPLMDDAIVREMMAALDLEDEARERAQWNTGFDG